MLGLGLAFLPNIWTTRSNSPMKWNVIPVLTLLGVIPNDKTPKDDPTDVLL